MKLKKNESKIYSDSIYTHWNNFKYFKYMKYPFMSILNRNKNIVEKAADNVNEKIKGGIEKVANVTQNRNIIEKAADNVNDGIRSNIEKGANDTQNRIECDEHVFSGVWEEGEKEKWNIAFNCFINRKVFESIEEIDNEWKKSECRSVFEILKMIIEWKGKVSFEEWIVFGKVLWAFCYKESEKCYTFQRVLGDYIRWTTQIVSERPIIMGECEKEKKHREKDNKFVNKARKRDEVRKLDVNREIYIVE